MAGSEIESRRPVWGCNLERRMVSLTRIIAMEMEGEDRSELFLEGRADRSGDRLPVWVGRRRGKSLG